MNYPAMVASRILDEYWDARIPINPAYFAEKLGLRVELSMTMGQKLSEYDAQSKTIRVNATRGPEARRIAVARELGHFCLGHGSSKPDTSAPNWFRVDPAKELAASQFAAELIIPALALKAMVDLRGIKDPVALRKAFGVSSQVLYCRLKELGYFL